MFEVAAHDKSVEAYDSKRTSISGDAFDVQCLGLVGSSILSSCQTALLHKLKTVSGGFDVKVRTLIKKLRGDGVGSIKSNATVSVKFYTVERRVTMQPRDDDLSQYLNGIVKLGIDGTKAGSIAEDVGRVVGRSAAYDMRFSNGHAICRRLAFGEDYRHMMIKGVLTHLTLNGLYTFGETNFRVADIMPTLFVAEPQMVLFNLHTLERVVVNADLLTDEEIWTLAVIAGQYPQIKPVSKESIYTNLKLKADGVSMMTYVGRRWNQPSSDAVTPPELFGRNLLGIAESLGCVDDLAWAYNYILGMPDFYEHVFELRDFRKDRVGANSITVDIDVPLSHGFRSVMERSAFKGVGEVVKATNLLSSSSILVVGGILGWECWNCILYQLDRYGLVLKQMYGNSLLRAGIGRSIITEYGYGSVYGSSIKTEMMARLGKVDMPWDRLGLLETVVEAASLVGRRLLQGQFARIQYLFNVRVSPLFAFAGQGDVSSVVGKDLHIPFNAWITKNPGANRYMVGWFIVHGLSVEQWTMIGLGGAAFKGTTAWSSTQIDLVSQALGDYASVNSQITLTNANEPRSGAELLLENATFFEKTYFGSEERNLWQELKEGRTAKVVKPVPIDDKGETTLNRPRPMVTKSSLPEAAKLARAQGSITTSEIDKVKSRLGPAEALKGAAGFIRHVAPNGKIRMSNTPSDGLCAASALEYSLERLGVVLDRGTLRAQLNDLTDRANWFSAEEISNLAIQYGFGVMVGIRNTAGTIDMHPTNVANVDADNIVCIIHDEGHFWYYDPEGDREERIGAVDAEVDNWDPEQLHERLGIVASLP
jgi:hypothetical protein